MTNDWQYNVIVHGTNILHCNNIRIHSTNIELFLTYITLSYSRKNLLGNHKFYNDNDSDNALATIIYYCRMAVLGAGGSQVQRTNRRSQASPTTPTSHVPTVSSSPSGKTSTDFVFLILLLFTNIAILAWMTKKTIRYMLIKSILNCLRHK